MAGSSKVKSARMRTLMGILSRTKVKVSPTKKKYSRPTSTAEKRKATKKASPKKSKCRSYLKKKIGVNMQELKKGRYKSRVQAVAVSYSQVLKKHPSCKRVLKRKASPKRK